MKDTIAQLRATVTMLRMKLGEKVVECERLKEEIEFEQELNASLMEQIKQLEEN